MSSAQILARNVRRLRTERQLSLGELATQAGVAKQTLANLESGKGNPTVETMLAVARALGVGSTWLLAEWGSPVVVHRRSEATWTPTNGARLRELDATFGTGDVNAAVLQLEHAPGTRTPMQSGTLLHAYVISGRVLAGTVDDQHRLASGDFIRFPGDVTHLLTAASGTATIHLVTTVPRVRQFGSP